jgi:hypothetical protein
MQNFSLKFLNWCNFKRAIYRLNCLQSNAITIAKNQQNRQRMVIVNVQETTEFLQKLGITVNN